MSNVNVINNAGKDINVTVNGNADKIEIVIDLAKKDFKLPKDLNPGDTFKDIDGDEYVCLYYFPNGDVSVLTKEPLTEMKFGSNNNYDGSDVDKYLCDTYLPELERKFGKENIVKQEINLLSLDGEDDYGKINRKVSILTLNEYRYNKKAIKKYLGKCFWLCTPDSTLKGCNSGDIQVVDSDGCVGYYWYGDVGSVRPRFILKSSIFEG